MKLVIDIDEELYKSICDCDDAQILSHFAIKNGTPYEERSLGEWIPCSERLPKPDKYVLVCSDEGNIEVAEGFISTEIEKFVWLTSGWRFGTVIAWMPLPEPYKKEGDEK